jgi:uncharacterized protein YqiB (DUF1249 family)
MFVDSLIVPQCIYRPGSFTGLMTIYESNYLKLDRLLGCFPQGKAVWTSAVPEDCDLHLEVLRREPYTTTLRMTYWFEESSVGNIVERIADPDLSVRVYHDARLAQAVAARVVHRHPKLLDLDPAHSTELDRRWRTNMMLNKWLDYLSDMGHSFG